MEILYVMLSLYIRHVCSSSVAYRSWPYYVMNSSNPEANVVEETMECTQVRSTVDTCAEECFNREKSGVQCIGFIGHGSGSCTLCQPRNSSSEYTSIVSSDTLYILQKQRKEPDLHISLNNVQGQALFRSGKSSVVAPNKFEELSLTSGKENQAVKFLNGGNLGITVSESDCFCNFMNCPGTSISVSLWVKVQSIAFGHIITPNANSQGLVIGK